MACATPVRNSFENLKPLLLASGSPRRQELLAKAGIAFEILVPGIPEAETCDDGPRALVLLNAGAKAEAVAADHPGRVVLAADTIVVLGDQIFGKPTDPAHAETMLANLSGKTHEVLTAVVIRHTASGRVADFVETTRVRFRDLDSAFITRYVRETTPFDKAGAYSAQDDDGRLILDVDGPFDNIVGLPVKRVREVLQNEFSTLLRLSEARITGKEAV